VTVTLPEVWASVDVDVGLRTSVDVDVGLCASVDVDDVPPGEALGEGDGVGDGSWADALESAKARATRAAKSEGLTAFTSSDLPRAATTKRKSLTEDGQKVVAETLEVYL
jgi:hypothetical protein